MDTTEAAEIGKLETALLSALIIAPEQIPDAVEIFEIRAVSDPNRRRIYAELAAMFDEGAKIELYTLSIRPNIRPLAKQVAKLVANVGSGAGALTYARQLKEIQMRQQLSALGSELIARCESTSDIAKIFDWAGSRYDEILQSISERGIPVHISGPLQKAIKAGEHRQQMRQEGEPVGITTGLERLDRVLGGGWRGAQLVILAGRPAQGKTATMLHFAKSAAASGASVVLFSLEMSAESLCDRLLVGMADIDSTSWRGGYTTAADWPKIEQANREVSELPIYLNPTADISLRSIRAQCMMMRKRAQCDVVMIDYLQLLNTSSAKGKTREREVAELSRGAKLLAKELDIPVIMLAQLNRAAEGRTENGPMLSDLRESGAIEQDADVVLFVDRPKTYGVDFIEVPPYGSISTEGVMRINIAKQRDGMTGKVIARHNLSLTRITDYDAATSSGWGSSTAAARLPYADDREDGPF